MGLPCRIADRLRGGAHDPHDDLGNERVMKTIDKDLIINIRCDCRCDQLSFDMDNFKACEEFLGCLITLSEGSELG